MTDRAKNLGMELVNCSDGCFTKREYFAIMAMQGILADPNVFKAEAAANLAIECADALLEELAK